MIGGKCDKCGPIIAETAGICPYCGQSVDTYDAGPPKSADGPCMLRPAFKPHESWTHGRYLSSWSDYHKANKELGLVDTGRGSSMKREHAYRASACSFNGQRNRGTKHD